MTNRQWRRQRDLALPLGGRAREVWELHEDGRPVASYPMDVTLGKPFDVMRMKANTVDQLASWVDGVRDTVAKLYAPENPRARVETCPACGVSTDGAADFCVVHGIQYGRCASCGHVFVKERPTEEVINRLFADNDDYSRIYVDRDSLDQRLAQITTPKLDWVRAAYRAAHGRDARRVIDVGAGGGHFVETCRRAGLDAEGYEINAAARGFARDAFGLDLRGEDYLAADIAPGAVDIVTFWGLLEYTPRPATFLAAARRQLAAENGLLVIEVPRADGLGTAIQTQYPDLVWRHAEPSSHFNLYSDAGLAALLHDNGFRPVAAWYFGMDFYEMLSMFTADLAENAVMEKFARLVSPMQHWLDAAEFSDDIIVVAVPT